MDGMQMTTWCRFEKDNKTSYGLVEGGQVIAVDGTPFGVHPTGLGPKFNVRAGVQYTIYTKFDGAASNYDGLGHNASDNNTLRVFLWFAL